MRTLAGLLLLLAVLIGGIAWAVHASGHRSAKTLPANLPAAGDAEDVHDSIVGDAAAKGDAHARSASIPTESELSSGGEGKPGTKSRSNPVASGKSGNGTNEGAGDGSGSNGENQEEAPAASSSDRAAPDHARLDRMTSELDDRHCIGCKWDEIVARFGWPEFAEPGAWYFEGRDGGRGLKLFFEQQFVKGSERLTPQWRAPPSEYGR